jgi:hypothetical protein
MFFGRYGTARLGLEIDPAREIREYAELVTSFLSAMDNVERSFDAPTLAELPPALLYETRGEGKFAHDVEYLMLKCPLCGGIEKPGFIGDPPMNVISLGCRAIFFAGPHPPARIVPRTSRSSPLP